MISKLRRFTFLSLILTFIWIILTIFVPTVSDVYQGLLPFILFSILGAILVFLVSKSKLRKKHRKYLLMVGFSAAGVMVGVLFHNLFYALGIKLEHIGWLSKLMGAAHVLFFFLAMVISPIGFIVGVIGSFVTHKKFS